jgi:23S rRNA (adenine2503-C2)-methyltransferase
MKKLLLGMSTAELKLLAKELGAKEFRGKQVADWLYRQGCHEISQMANLPASFRERLEEGYETGRSKLKKASVAGDGTFKLLLRPAFGELVEAVGIPYQGRFSCCVSTQIGCPVGCLFCATGASGFKRNLAAGEIVDQVLAVGDYARSKKPLAEDGRVSHVVFMGMGEPLLNYDATLAAVRLVNSEFNIGMRNITLSTIGYVPGIYRLAGEDLQLTLAISLHAADDALRRKLVPGMTRYSLQEIVDACKHYFRETKRRVTFEYCLLKDINDGQADAAMLAAMLQGLSCHVNVIPFNSFKGGGFHASEAARIAAFCRVLEEADIAVTKREQRGEGIEAACGQLRRQVLTGQGDLRIK